MSERVAHLANRFEQASNEFLPAASVLSAEQWAAAPRDGDIRSAGVIAHHVATAYPATIELLSALLDGVDLDLTMDQIHSLNAGHAEANQGVNRDETIALLQSNAADAVTALCGLSEAQLDQMVYLPLFGDRPVPAQAIIEGLVIGHIGMHAQDLSA